ncbi:Cysteine ABC transporter ATP-binding protein [Pseudoalteromonas carrageenovora]|uniref:ATP-binding cassette, subfamily C, bacterial CydC n=1 Tax=Pseudoalteromonas carrageenovora IAM 12662 TaxID=1314868 RepID=A0A2K4XAU7_PSEVC|nr:thiol reductant ABC exporter subunit CydC [Pseudoalteromonas carrageenovora]MBE0383896.1 ATP-binding cassette, subfamily C, bacterial CydC [Pseudoalteromonas carrageenovora IAM 12662]QBJ72336.1 Cysteine ABC transporter ATP-binding protein [Pseudoalteromonas carrageenovora]GEB71380.1 cysteine/glutathione ABC transporter ATP-binding protein/permease CydC [Pseudoalteromonas carrageenovora]SOU41452.1 Cysteine ABC transporter ATP-binding protein [Pseudoalteromonas carrageenovora IAM 12662]
MTNFIRLLKLCRPHYKAMLLGTFLATLTVLANVGLLAISGWFLASMAAAGIAGVQMNYFTPAGTIRFLAIVRTASRYGERLVTHNATFLLLSEIRVNMFATLSKLNNVDLAMSRSADLVNRLQNDVDALDKFYLNILLPMLVALLSIPIIMVFMAAYNANVALICFTGILLIGVVLPALLSAKLNKNSHKETQLSAQLRAELSDTLTGLRELSIYQAGGDQISKCDDLNEQYNQQLYSRHKALANSDGLSLLVVQLAMLGAIVTIVPLVYSGAMVNVELAMLSLFVLASFESVLLLPNAFIELPNVLKAAERLFTLQDKVSAQSNNHSALIDTQFDKNNTALTLNNISYKYDEHNALTDVSFMLKAQQKVAIVGRSGSGKTTLVNLLTGLWPLQQGSITLGDQNNSQELHSLSNDTRASFINILAQQHHIFDGTLSENLRYAAPSATKEEMLEAIKLAQLEPWFNDLQKGLKTRLGIGGRSVSQGQSRRIAIAQALLQNPAILVLDEPTEGLDNQSKQTVMNAIMQVMGNASVLTITHDPALLTQMNNVIWLEDGKVVAQGSHKELSSAYPDYVALTTRF